MDHSIKVVAETYEQLGTILGTARALDMPRTTVRDRLKKAGLYDQKPLFAGRVSPMEVRKLDLPKPGKIKRYFLTSAQNNTLVAPKVWGTILTIVEHYDATLMVGTFTYNKASYGKKSAKLGRGPTASDTEELWYDEEIAAFISDDPVQLAPGLQWRGEMNILPTAIRPLSELEQYTGRPSGIFPHVKVAMASVASGKYEATKFNYTTGTTTKRNYIQKKAGQRADFSHSYGGLIVEVNADGDWFVRQVTVDANGVAYDLDVRFDQDEATTGHRVKTITWGDIHNARIDEGIASLCWDDGGMMDVLQPEQQYMHDLMSMEARSPHNIKSRLIHDHFAAYCSGHDEVEKEIRSVAMFLDKTARPGCKTYIVDSNHHDFMMEWLRIGDYKRDSINAIYFLTMQLFVYTAIRNNPDHMPNLLQWAVETVNGGRDDTVFLNEDESQVVLGIEHGIHGHRGPNGARGSETNLAKLGRPINRGHSHSASIYNEVFTAGLTGVTDQGYNKGPGSWSASHIITYANGKRAICTMWNNKWRA